MGERPRNRHVLRLRAAERAAELMYFEGIKEYLRAKRKAARHIGVTVYPNNAEIREALDRLAEANEGPARQDRLLALRRTALEVMEVLDEFDPRLIGSVLTGHIKTTSDVDLHAFSDDHELVGDVLVEAGYDVSFELVKTKKGGEFMDFPHYYLAAPAGPVEVSVYPREDLKRPQKSSITHKRMERATISKVRRLIAAMEATLPTKEE
ncbi:MAG: hypothetical protein HY815_07955 [Candidatus Riflebacteria bacterium]|nr:hypothetical protein [Candidatus Riflebacteria bacterium]